MPKGPEGEQPIAPIIGPAIIDLLRPARPTETKERKRRPTVAAGQCIRDPRPFPDHAKGEVSFYHVSFAYPPSAETAGAA